MGEACDETDQSGRRAAPAGVRPDRSGPALTIDEQEFVLRHWQESQNATTATALAGAFFTPLDLAFDFAIEVAAGRIIDLGAGIGTLSWAVHRHLTASPSRPRPELVCVERNREYVRVGRRVLPEADWICADLFDLPMDFVGAFDTVIGCARPVTDQAATEVRTDRAISRVIAHSPHHPRRP